jgi:diguanylate cyclase (GGDEF)-like protein
MFVSSRWPRWLFSIVFLVGLGCFAGGLSVLSSKAGRSSSPRTVSSPIDTARSTFLKADRARLQSLVADPISFADTEAAFDQAIQGLEKLATSPGVGIWSPDGRQLLDRYRLAGEAQFDALSEGNLFDATQIAATDGTNSASELLTHLDKGTSRTATAKGLDPVWGPLLAAFGLVLAGGSYRLRRRLRRRAHSFPYGLSLVPNASIVTDLNGVEIERNAAFAEFATSNEIPDLIGLYRREVGSAKGNGPWTILCPGGPGDRQTEVTILKVVHADTTLLSWTLRDVTEKQRVEADLLQRAFHDSLTDLPNRALFRDRTVQALARSERSNAIVSVLFIDLDGFKNVNDSLGHDAGDELIVEMANRLRGIVRSSDTLARLGGDEFAVLLEDPRTKLADFFADRVLEAIGLPIRLRGQEIFVGASVGVAECSPGISSDALLRNADTAMYAAKERGKNRVVRFHNQMFQEAADRLELDNELRRAVELNQLRLYYQPIVSLHDKRMVGFEALLRWFHPQRGVVPPDVFVPLAEETGSIVEIGRWVMRTAIQQAAHFPAEYPLSINVNISARQILDDRLLEIVAEELKQSGLAPDRVVLEITESMFLQDIDATVRRLEQFRALGVRLAIDDFGTGYSSLSYLHRLPVQSVKIDRSFIANRRTRAELDADPFIIAIVDLAKTLGFTSVAEGVETEDQVQWLTERGCDLGQGYFFAQALPAESIQGMLDTLLPKQPPSEAQVS